jgi:hypothetical protein
MEQLSENKIELENLAVESLTNIRKWTRFLAVAGFVYIGIMLVIFTLPLFGGMNSHLGYGFISFIFIAIMVLIYFFPLYFLYKFSQRTKVALENQNSESLTEALNYLHYHYRYIGILFIVLLSIYLLFLFVILLMKEHFMRLFDFPVNV